VKHPIVVPVEGPMSYDEALDLASRDDRFKATVYAMNSLLIHRGIYTRAEFEELYVEWVAKEIRKSGDNGRAAVPITAAGA
jgi:hypothetical protein